MSQNRDFTRGFVAIERFLMLMIYSKKIGTKRLYRNLQVVAIQNQRFCNWEVPLFYIYIYIKRRVSFGMSSYMEF